MKVTVTPTRNGVYVEYDDGENVDRMSYKFDQEENDLEDALAFLCDLTDFVGLMGSRYSKVRLVYKIVHGDKYECEGCEICNEEN